MPSKVKKLAIFASHRTGFEIIKHLMDVKSSEISFIFLTDINDIYAERISHFTQSDKFVDQSIKIEYGKDSWRTYIEELKNIDAILTIYWPWILPEESYENAQITCNLHPALLPENRGWYPHVYNIINNTLPGVSLHKLEKTADTGDLWVQKKVPLLHTDTAKEIYIRLQDEIIKLFKENWPKILKGERSAKPQNHQSATYNTKNSLEAIDYIQSDQLYIAEDLLRLLKARSFGQKGFAYTINKGRRTYYKIEVSDSEDFSEK